jgi:hypothetical protein
LAVVVVAAAVVVVVVVVVVRVDAVATVAQRLVATLADLFANDTSLQLNCIKR